MYQEFFIGQSAEERCRKIDISAFETIQQLRASLGRLFSFADPSCKFNTKILTDTKNSQTASNLLPQQQKRRPLLPRGYQILQQRCGVAYISKCVDSTASGASNPSFRRQPL